MIRTITGLALLLICGSVPLVTNAAIEIANTGGGQAHGNIQPSLGINYMIALQGLFPSRDKSVKGEPYLGEVVMFAGNFAPQGWAFCDGQILPINQNQSLYSLLGTTYGGDGRITFALPDLRGRTAVQQGQGAGLTNRRLGEKFGIESVPLSVDQMPSHSHTFSQEVPQIDFPTEATGGDQPHANVQPGLGLNYTVNLVGVYPSRSKEEEKGADPFIAEIDMFAGKFAPRGTAFPQGQLLPIAQNIALFSLIGPTYGGDGRTTFALPDLQGRAVMGVGTGPGLTPRYWGRTTGVEQVTLSEAQVPSHTHEWSWDDASGTTYTGNTDATGGSQAHTNMQPSIALNYMIALQGIAPSSIKAGDLWEDLDKVDDEKGIDPFLGEIRLFAGNFAPRGWALCEGQLLAVSQYDALFSILGTTYGGDGETTFALPDLRGRVPVHPGTGPGLSPWQLGQKRGAETTTLTVAQLPTHSHAVIPEPATFVLAIAALLSLFAVRRK